MSVNHVLATLMLIPIALLILSIVITFQKIKKKTSNSTIAINSLLETLPIATLIQEMTHATTLVAKQVWMVLQKPKVFVFVYHLWNRTES
jgi:hypothetical protein